MTGKLIAPLRHVFNPESSDDWKIQFFQHVITGGIATSAHYVVMWFALSGEMLPALATTMGFVVGATTRFLFSYFYIFKPERDVVSALPHFVLALALAMVLNTALLMMFLAIDLPVWPSQVLTTGLLAGLNFLGHKFWVFK